MSPRRQREPGEMRIEINLDAEYEALGGEAEMADSRLLRARVTGWQLAGTGRGAVSLAADGELAARIREGSVAARQEGSDGVVDFRVELDVAAIERLCGGSVSRADGREFRFVIRVPVMPRRATDPEEIEWSVSLKVNCRAIRWWWQALERDADTGAVQEVGEPSDCTPVEIEMDGEGLAGARIGFELRRPGVDQGGVEADFCVPEFEKNLGGRAAPNPLPWERTGGTSLRFIESEWWSAPEDASLAAVAPTANLLRVLAFPEGSIQSHGRDAWPETKPPQRAPLARRDVPVQLLRSPWQVEVIEPDPDALPPLIEGERWKEGFEVRLCIFRKDEDSGEERPVSHRDVAWEVEGSESDSAGDVLGTDGQVRQTGVWTTDENGEITFTFRPKAENAILFGSEKAKWHAGFALWRGARCSGKPAAKVSPADGAGREDGPSFVLDWAPAIDLGILKRPYVMAQDLDPAAVPPEEIASPIPVAFSSPAAREDYRKRFRHGGRLELRPRFTREWEAAGAEPRGADPSPVFRDYRLIIGEQAGRKRVVAVEPPENWSGDRIRPTCEVPASPLAPGQKGSRETEATLVLDLPVSLVRSVSRELEQMIHNAGEVVAACGTMASLAGPIPGRPASDFGVATREFVARLLEQVASDPQERLIEHCQKTVAHLQATAAYGASFPAAWKCLDASVALHAKAVERTLANAVNFLFDFLFCDELTVALKKLGATQLSGALEWFQNTMGVNARLLNRSVDACVTKALQKKLVAMHEAMTPTLQGMKKSLEGIRAAMGDVSIGDSEARRLLASAYADFHEVSARFGAATRGLLGRGARARAIREEIAATPVELRPALVARYRATVQQLRRDARATYESWKRSKAALEEHLTGRTGTGLRQASVRTIGAEARKRSASAEACLLNAQVEHFSLAERRLADAREALGMGVVAPSGAEDLRRVQGHLEELQAAISSPCPQGVVLQGQSLRESAEIQRVSDGFREACESVQADLRALTDGREGLDALDLLGDGADWGAAVVPLGSRNLSAAVRESEAFEAAARFRAESLAKASEVARERLRTQGNNLVDRWRAGQAIIGENLSDAVKSGQDSFVASIAEPGAVEPQSPAGEEGWIEWGLRPVFALLDLTRRVFMSAVAACAQYYSQLGGFLKWIISGFFWCAHLLFKMVAMAGAKLFEALLGVFDAVRSVGGYRDLSSLGDGALAAAKASIRQAGESSPAFAEESAIFAFPYLEGGVVESWARWLVDLEEPPPRDGANAAASGVLEGYRTYYPRAVGDAREVFFQFWSGMQSMAFLDNATALKEPAELMSALLSLRQGREAMEALAKEIGDYTSSFENAGDSGEFSDSTRALLRKPAWNSADYDHLADKIGSVFSWQIRWMGLIVALFTWATGLGFVVGVGTFLTAAALGSAVTALCRVMAALFGYYLHTTAYPRDVVMLQAALHATCFLPAEQRFHASGVEGFRKS